MLDVQKFVDGIHEYVERACSPIVSRIKSVEARFDALPVPEDGKDADMAAVAKWIDEAAAKMIAAIPAPIHGKDADPEFIRQEVAKAVAAIPRPKDGEPGVDGKDADAAEIEKAVLARVTAAFDAIPAPKDGAPGKDGKDADKEEIAQFIREQVAGAPRPKDGAPGKDADPAQVASMVDEAVAKIPVPKDGAPGKDADPVLVKTVLLEAVAAEVAKIPHPKDGQPGKSVTIDDIRPMFEAEVAKWALDFERRGVDIVQRSIERIPQPKGDVNDLADRLILRFTQAAANA